MRGVLVAATAALIPHSGGSTLVFRSRLQAAQVAISAALPEGAAVGNVSALWRGAHSPPRHQEGRPFMLEGLWREAESLNIRDIIGSAEQAEWLALLLTVLGLVAVDILLLQPCCELGCLEPPPDAVTALEGIYGRCKPDEEGRIQKKMLVELCESDDAAAALFGLVRGADGRCATSLAAPFRHLGMDDELGIDWEELRHFYATEVRPGPTGSASDSSRDVRRHAAVVGFWLLVGAACNAAVWLERGREAGIQWCTGYLVEWLLSLDNLFIFHLILQAYATPRSLFHRALFLGIFGAAAFRMCFFATVASLLHLVQWARIVFGVLLVYSGIQAARDSEELAPTDVVDRPPFWLLKCCLGSRLLDKYDLPGQRLLVWQGGKWRLTLLVPVVISLELTDILFAMDSVTAKVAQIPDYYIASSSSLVAMFGLRAMFFVVQDLVDSFALMKYGLCFILVFMGIELMASSFVHLPAQVVLAVIVAVLLVCISGSAASKRSASRQCPQIIG